MKKWQRALTAVTVAVLVTIPHVNAQENRVAGGWTTFSSDISSDATEVFETATQGLLGVAYEPVAVATQVVAGLNYRKICNAKVVYPGAPSEAALITIYQPLNGPPRIVEISKLDD